MQDKTETTSITKSPRGQISAVVDTLGRRIVAGTYPELSTLAIEQELAASLGVGRNALREAVKVLSGKGLIATAPRSGTKVKHRSEWNMLDRDVLTWHADPEIATREFMLDLIEVRQIIEPIAAELAAKRATRDDIAEILAAYEAMASSEDQQQRLDADIDFHTAVLKASGNVVLSHFNHAISTYLKAHIKHGQDLSAQASKDDLERHHQIAWSIASGKAVSARELTVEMLDSNRSHFQQED